MSDPRDHKMIFAMSSPDAMPDGVPVLFFIMTDAAFAYMQNGLGHDADLTNVGIPLKIVIGRAKDHADGIATLASLGVRMPEAKDVRDVDVRFDQPPKRRN